MEMEKQYAIIFGVLLATENKITSAKVNKIAVNKLGYERMPALEIQELYNDLANDPTYDEIITKAIQGEYKLEDLRDYKSEQVFESNDYINEVTPSIIAQEEQRASMRHFNKVMKSGAYMASLMNNLKVDLEDAFSDFDVVEYKKPEVVNFVEDDSETMILTLSDFHVGFAFTDSLSDGYNFEVLKKRLKTYLDRVHEMIADRNISNFRIYFVGDLIEHVSMRNVNQAFETEFTLSEQIAKGIRLLSDIIEDLNKYGNVTFSIVHGNHDRLQGNKNDKIYNDSVAYIALDQLLFLQEHGAFQGVNIIDNRKDIHNAVDTVYNYNIALNHGESLPNKKPVMHKLPNSQSVDILITGHVHHFYVIQENKHSLHVVNSSPIGYNNYSKEHMFGYTSPSQTVMILSDNEKRSPEIIPVFLNGDA